MAANIGNFFARLFLGGIIVTALNFVFYAVGLFLAARLLAMEKNTLGRALSVSLIILIVSFIPKIFFFVDEFFSLILMFTVMVAAVKTIYRCDWLNAVFAVIVATVIAVVASIALNPLFTNLAFETDLLF